AGTSFINLGFLSFEAISDRAIEDLGMFSNGGTLAGNAPGIVLTSDLGGTIAPGFSPGTIAFAEDQAFLPGTRLEMDVEGTGTGEADLVDVNGTVDLTNLNLVVSVDYTPNDGDEVTIVTATSITGDFATTDLPPGWSVVIDASVRLVYDAGILPVEFVRFTAEKVDKTVRLDWETTEEVDNEGFEIQRSTDGAQWEMVGFVAGSGSTSEIQAYRYVHVDPVAGDNYYRLRQLDFDGQFTDSQVRIVNFAGVTTENTLAVFPNPAREFATVGLPRDHGPGRLLVFNTAGQIVQQIPVSPGQAQLELDVSEWPAGAYTVQVVLRQRTLTNRLLR
ncbi:MAG: T9SS type A sorting domain-containing protein, partial [Bacteroidota bacterium]